MNIYFVFLVVLAIIGSKIYIKNFNSNYIDKACTSCVNGLFVLIVFYSHLATYIDVQYSKDFLMYDFRNYIGQLMVTTFLFYSGYGIYYQIKHKKNKYINSLPINRILKTWLKFVIAIISFIIINLILKQPLSISKVVLSFIGWDNIGNSNWYIFSVIIMYILTFISFKLLKDNKKALILNSCLILLYIIILSIFKEDYWYNTLSCYLFGMIYCYKKESIEKILTNNLNYIITLAVTTILFIFMRRFIYISFWCFEIYSVIFIALILLITFKVNFGNKILKWFGEKVFWIYILQRIPMMFFKEIGLSIYAYKYSIIVFVSTVLLALIYSLVFDKLINKLILYINKKA